MTPLVVKVGGSLAESGRLAEVLDIVAAASRPVVLVAGGGSFADAVRRAQVRLGYSDTAAHRMAILAMHQMAEVCASLNAHFVVAETIEDMARIAAAGSNPIWLPLRLCEEDASIPADWSITSDGLAARLAERLGGAPVVLVKSCDMPANTSLADLAASGVVDRVFPEIVARAGLIWHVLSADDERALRAVLDSKPAAP